MDALWIAAAALGVASLFLGHVLVLRSQPRPERIAVRARARRR